MRMRKSLRIQGRIYLPGIQLGLPLLRNRLHFLPISSCLVNHHCHHHILLCSQGLVRILCGGVHHKEVIDHADFIEDTQFYQDAALDYQNTYEALHAQQVEPQGKYSLQAYLIKEASAAIKAVEAEAQCQHQELLDAEHNHQIEIESAVSRAVGQYDVQLSNAQSCLQT